MKKITYSVFFILVFSAIILMNTKCDDVKTARVTINITRNDLAVEKMKKNQKSLFDRFLEFFATKAYAQIAPTNWPDAQGDLTLYITGEGMSDVSLAIPSGATSFTTEVEPGHDREIKVISDYSGNKNWGAREVRDLYAGTNTINLKMIPMVTNASASPGTVAEIIITIDNVYDSLATTQYNVQGYNFYRATSINGPYTNVGSELSSFSSNATHSDTGLTSGTTYYYRVSAYGSDGEGVLCDAVSEIAPF